MLLRTIGSTAIAMIACLAAAVPVAAAPDEAEPYQIWLAVAAPPDLNVLDHLSLKQGDTEFVGTCTPDIITGAAFLEITGVTQIRCTVPEPGDYVPTVIDAPEHTVPIDTDCGEYHPVHGFDGEPFAHVTGGGLDMLCYMYLSPLAVLVSVSVDDDAGPLATAAAPEVIDADGNALSCIPDGRTRSYQRAIWCAVPEAADYTPRLTGLAAYTSDIQCRDENDDVDIVARPILTAPVAACEIQARPAFALSLTGRPDTISGTPTLTDAAGTDFLANCDELDAARITENPPLDDGSYDGARAWHCDAAPTAPVTATYDAGMGDGFRTTGDCFDLRCDLHVEIGPMPAGPNDTIPDTGLDTPLPEPPFVSLPDVLPDTGATHTGMLLTVALGLALLGGLTVAVSRSSSRR